MSLLAAQSMFSSGAIDGVFSLLELMAFALWVLLAGSSLAYLIYRYRRRGPLRLLGLRIAGALLLPALTGVVGAFVTLILVLSPGAGMIALLVPAAMIAIQLGYLRLVRCPPGTPRTALQLCSRIRAWDRIVENSPH